MSGQTVVVTGANSGLGYHASVAFARAGARVVLACRDTTSGANAVADLQEQVAAPDVEVRKLDLADLSSVERFAEGVRADYDGLDVLCNNAGVMAIPREETADGFEKQFGVNHLGHFALTGHLLGLLRDADGESRVVTHSSGAHEQGKVDFADLQGERDYDKWSAYSQSKLANLLFALELDRRLDRADVADVTSVACHPGWAATNLQRRGPEKMGSKLRLAFMTVANALLAQDAAQGALPMLYAATHDSIRGGEYIGPDGFMSMRGYPTRDEPSERARDAETARRLWEVSEELTGVTYDLQAAVPADD